jgi:hypothetical protein
MMSCERRGPSAVSLFPLPTVFSQPNKDAPDEAIRRRIAHISLRGRNAMLARACLHLMVALITF